MAATANRAPHLSGISTSRTERLSLRAGARPLALDSLGQVPARPPNPGQQRLRPDLTWGSRRETDAQSSGHTANGLFF